MKKFILSVAGGCVVGGLLAWAFIIFVPQLPDFLARTFFTPVINAPHNITQNIQNAFSATTDQYIIESVDQAIPQDTKVVYADLGAMKISLYENGTVIEEYPIQSVGREGTAWQTPLGKFDMSYKMENHFSSIGHVYMPFSMHFFGNYFIHGWPYYADGTPVPKGYSGGCIRLNTPDSEHVFDFVDKNTELIVTTSADKILKQGELQYVLTERAPELDSRFLVVDLETGEVVATQGGTEKVAIGSFAKLMTALISLESLNQYQETVLRQDIVNIADVLYALLLGDDDDAGKLLYEHKHKAQYLLDMNTRAKSLGMSATTYTDVNGTSSSTVSTLEDSFRLFQYMNSYKPFMLKALSLDEYEIAGTTYEALHPLRETDGYVAGFADDSNSELATLVSVDIKRVEMEENPEKTFVILVEGSENAKEDTLRLYEWVKGSVEVR